MKNSKFYAPECNNHPGVKQPGFILVPLLWWTHQPCMSLFYPQFLTPNQAPGLPLHLSPSLTHLLMLVSHYHSYEAEFPSIPAHHTAPSLPHCLWNLNDWTAAWRSNVLTCIDRAYFFCWGVVVGQTVINWECATNSYGNKVSKYLIIACVSKCLLTRFVWRICKAAATLLHPSRHDMPAKMERFQ